MRIRTIFTMLFIAASIIATSSVAYDLGYNAECTFGKCGELGGLLGAIMVMIVWVIFLFLAIIIFKKIFAFEVNHDED